MCIGLNVICDKLSEQLAHVLQNTNVQHHAGDVWTQCSRRRLIFAFHENKEFIDYGNTKLQLENVTGREHLSDMMIVGGIILNGIWNEQDVRVCTSCISLGVRSNGWFLWAFWFHKRRGTASNVQSTPHLVSCHVMNLLNLSLIKFHKLWFSFRIVKLVDVLMSPVCPWTLDSQTTDDITSCFIFNFQHKYN
jgi:hypothetical protein